MQQFLYTFRYFCTPHDFLHFLLDRINSTLSRYGPAHEAPHRRTVDPVAPCQWL